MFTNRFSCSKRQVAAMEETASVINGERLVDALVFVVFLQKMILDSAPLHDIRCRKTNM